MSERIAPPARAASAGAFALINKSPVAYSDADELSQNRKQPVSAICLIKAMETVRATHNQTGRLQPFQFVLSCTQGKPAFACQLANVLFRGSLAKKKAQQFRARMGKQGMQQIDLFFSSHVSFLNLTD